MSTYIDTNKSWADIKAGWLRMWHPFLVYADKPTKALDQVTAIKCRKTSPHSRLIHTSHILFWAEDAYFSIHTTICFHTFKQLKFYNLMCNFQSSLRKSNSMRPSVFLDIKQYWTVVSYRCFGTTSQSSYVLWEPLTAHTISCMTMHLTVVPSILLGLLTHADGTDRLSRKIGN